MSSKSLSRTSRINRNDFGLDGSFEELTGPEELINYSPEIPYSIVWQNQKNASSGSHYSNNTLEVIVNISLHGVFMNGANAVHLTGKEVLFIPPGVMHSHRCDLSKEGTLINIKFDFSRLKEFVDVERMLAFDGYCIADLQYLQADYPETIKALERLVDADLFHFERIARVIDLFGVWVRSLQAMSFTSQTTETNRLNELIRWTRNNFMNHITIDDAANLIHMSRSYFCKYFKERMNITYIDYLNRLRINRASIMLMNGMNASEVFTACGFSDLPYFIQLFKKYTGCTTREFVKSNQMKKNLLHAESK